jgi:hypothetical protein
LFDQFVESASARSRYYPGPGAGTPDSGGFGSASINPTPAILATAEKAYVDFRDRASLWYINNPNGEVTAAITGFSRGGATAVAFARLLNERGLISPEGVVLIAPGQVNVSSMLLFDPVFTGVQGNLSLPSNVNGNVVVVRALDEFRANFRGADFGNDGRVRTVEVFGNHGDVGGFYDNGIGALVLQGATGFFQASGIEMAPVPPARQFDATRSPAIHSEGIDSFGNRIWDEYGTRGNRLLLRIPPPELSGYTNPNIESITRIVSADTRPQDPTTLVIVAFRDGTSVQQLLNGEGQPVLNAASGEAITRNTVTGFYSVTNATTQEVRVYDPRTSELTISAPGRATLVLDGFNAIIKVIEPTSGTPETTIIDGELFLMTANGTPYRKVSAGVGGSGLHFSLIGST